MKDTYGRTIYKNDHWEDYPVQPGETWTAGAAAIGCFDLEEDAWRQMVARYGKANLVYVDPPWGQALASGFRTKAGVPRTVKWADFVDRLAAVLAATTDGPIWCEMGAAWTHSTIDAIAAAGHRHVHTYTTPYYNGAGENHLIHFAAKDGSGADPIPDPALLTGPTSRIPAHVLTHTTRPGDLIADPCTGQGLSATSALGLGRRFYGYELHPRRISSALHAIHTLTGDTPQVS